MAQIPAILVQNPNNHNDWRIIPANATPPTGYHQIYKPFFVDLRIEEIQPPIIYPAQKVYDTDLRISQEFPSND